MVGYATAYTMLPVFSLVLDRDVNEDVALLYPELYKELTKVCCFYPSLSPPSEISLCFDECSGSKSVLQNLLHLAHDLALPR